MITIKINDKKETEFFLENKLNGFSLNTEKKKRDVGCL